MHRRELLFGILASAACAQEQAAEPAGAVFRAGVALVRIDAQVTGRNGKLATDLERADFAVFEEGERREIAYFGRDTEKLDLLLVLDVSGSMTKSLELVAATARSALRQLRAGDRVGVMTFARRSLVSSEFTSDLDGVASGMREAVQDKSLGAGTAINDALLAAASYAGKQKPGGRRAILILTDNKGLNYRVKDSDVLKALLDSNVVLNAIVVGRGSRTQPTGANPDFTPPDVWGLAERSGGEAVEAGKIGESFSEMIEKIRSRYSLHFAPAEGRGGYRRVRVELSAQARRTHAGARIRAREGFFYQP